jgi:DNA-binding MarR family transcriptional regulator
MMAGRRAGPARPGAWRDEAVERFVQLRPAVLARMTASTPPELRAEFENVTGRQLQGLNVLPEAGLTMSELASSLGVSGATASVLSDRLVSQGLAVRGTDPADRRIVRLAPSSRGTALAARYREAQRRAVAALLDCLTDEQVTAWLDIMQTLAGRDDQAGRDQQFGRDQQAGSARPAELAEAGR